MFLLVPYNHRMQSFCYASCFHPLKRLFFLQVDIRVAPGSHATEAAGMSFNFSISLLMRVWFLIDLVRSPVK